jgi:hypothetical protein
MSLNSEVGVNAVGSAIASTPLLVSSVANTSPHKTQLASPTHPQRQPVYVESRVAPATDVGVGSDTPPTSSTEGRSMASSGGGGGVHSREAHTTHTPPSGDTTESDDACGVAAAPINSAAPHDTGDSIRAAAATLSTGRDGSMTHNAEASGRGDSQPVRSCPALPCPALPRHALHCTGHARQFTRLHAHGYVPFRLANPLSHRLASPYPALVIHALLLGCVRTQCSAWPCAPFRIGIHSPAVCAHGSVHVELLNLPRFGVQRALALVSVRIAARPPPPPPPHTHTHTHTHTSCAMSSHAIDSLHVFIIGIALMRCRLCPALPPRRRLGPQPPQSQAVTSTPYHSRSESLSFRRHQQQQRQQRTHRQQQQASSVRNHLQAPRPQLLQR